MAKPDVPENIASARSDTEWNDDDTASRGYDDALKFAINGSEAVWDEHEERRVLWKIDLVVLPLLFFCAMIGFADAQAFGFAALFGLIKDLKLYTTELVNGQEVMNTDKYSSAAAIFNLGAVAGQYPVMYVAQYFSYGKAFGLTSMYAGMLALLILTCHNFSDIMALRFFYGFGYITQPMIIIIAAMWWKRNEQPVRLGLAIGGAAIGNLIGQGVDFGAVSIKGVYSESPWKYIYIILGSATLGIGSITFLLLPASPMKAWFLSEKEKTIAVRRLLENNTGIQTRKFKWRQLREAAFDPQLWLLCIYSFTFSFVNNAIGSFLGFLVSSFGYSQKQSLLMSMPVSAIGIVVMVGSGFLAWKFPGRRILISMLFILPSIAGSAMLWKSDRSSKSALLGGLYILPFFYGALIQQYAILSANIAGHTKKTVVNATIVVVAQLGGFSGPYSYHGDEADEGYPTGQISALCLLCVSEVAFASLWIYYHFRNKQKASYRDEHPELIADPKTSLVDLTDQENPVFQYAI